MKSTKKVAYPIILFALIVAVASFLSVKEVRKQEKQKREIAQSQDQKEYIDTRNWKTYKDEEYGFEFKYPEEWEEKIKDLKDGSRGLFFSADEDRKTYLSLIVDANHDEKDLTEVIKEVETKIGRDVVEKAEKKYKSFNLGEGVAYFIRDTDVDNNIATRRAFILLKGKLLFLVNSYDERCEEILAKQIINTIQVN